MKCAESVYASLIRRYLYCLDSAPIFLATAIFVVPGFFPGKLLAMDVLGREFGDAKTELTERSEGEFGRKRSAN